MKKLTTTALLAITAITACSPRDIEVSRKAHTLCIELAPATQDDPDGVLFETWAANREMAYGSGEWYANGVRVGFAADEGSRIWPDMECVEVDR